LDAGLNHRLTLAPRAQGSLYWDVYLLVLRWGGAALQTLPPPKDKTLYLVEDRCVKPRRGTQNPLAPKEHQSEHQAWLFGMRFALLIATWDVYRLLVAIPLVLLSGRPRPSTTPL
jgi:hypothetical protein